MIIMKIPRALSLVVSLVLAFFTLILTSDPVISAPLEEKDYGSHVPVLEDSFAESSTWSGPWLVFVQGSDPGGDMTYLWFEVTQLGGRNSTEIVTLKGENRRRFSGYVAIYLPRRFTGWETVRAEIRLKDSAGNYSAKRTHEVRVGAPTTQVLPEKWRTAAQNRLGNIFFTFDSDDSERDIDFRSR